MAEITAALVKDLRERSGAGMMDCKKALSENGGDIEASIDWLRTKGLAAAAKKAGRQAAEGLVGVAVSGTTGAAVEVNSETDFVAKNDEFLAMVNLAAKLVAENNPADVAALAALPHDGKTFDEIRTGLIGKIGENMSVRRFQRFETTDKLASYLHGTRIGVIVDFDGADEQVGKDVAMHIAAMKPVSLTSAEVPAELIAKERSVAAAKADEDKKTAEAAGKPVQSDEIVAKRIEGGVQKYLKEVSLFNQSFVKNDKQTVEQMLKAAGTTVKGFTLYVVGEGIEKKVDDFAAEVAAQVAAAQSAA